MLVVHFSDWHGDRTHLPDADLYVCTGDMYPDIGAHGLPDQMEAAQVAWLERHGPIVLGAPVLCVRGNHDWAPLAPLFDAPDVVEINSPHDCVYRKDVMFGGTRGVRWLGGSWSDELYEPELAGRLRSVGPLDALLTHGPAYGGLDASACAGYHGHVGSRALRSYLRQTQPIVHFHGHCHGAFGTRFEERTGLTTVNSACGWHKVQVLSNGTCRVIEAFHLYDTAVDPDVTAELEQADAEYQAIVGG